MSDTGKTGLPPDANTLPQADVLGTSGGQVERACEIARESGQRIADELGIVLARRQRLKVVSTFRRILFPPKRPGRRRKEAITAAHRDWKNGLRGPALFRRHILNWERHNHFRREYESRRLMSAIQSRERRARRERTIAETAFTN